MARIPVRFQRVAEAFDADAARVRLCESSGSEHSPESLTDLSDLVKSFMEKNERTDSNASVVREIKDYEEEEEEEEIEKSDRWCDSEKREMLEGLFAGNEVEDGDERNAREKLRGEVEVAYELGGGDSSSPGFKRRLMSALRDKGFDAGLCKSNWEKNQRFPAGDYEYIDVNFGGKRYIVEVSLAAEFEIARPANKYSSLLDVFPLIFVGEVEELKRVVRLMCNAIKGSMKRMDLHIPPWRRSGYMQAKWFSSYRRTTNAVTTRNISSTILSSESTLLARRSIGFEARPVKVQNCRDVYVTKTGFRVGHLTAALNS